MESNNGLKTIEDLIQMMNMIFSEIKKQIEDKGLGTRAGELLASAENPDGLFKAKLLMNYMEQMNRISVGIAYLNRPVKKEGVMQQKLDGTVMMGDEVIPGGTRLEYFVDNEWNYGILHQDAKTKRYSILDWNGEMKVERIEQIKGRIRGNVD